MRKKLFSSIAAAALTAAIISPSFEGITALAAEYAQNGYTLTYTITGETAQITGYTGSGTILMIPEQLEGYPVLSIGDEAFSGCTELISVTVPDSVVEIGANAFEKCLSLKTVSLGDSVSEIGDYAFSVCPQLSSFSVSSSNSTYTVLNGMLYSKDCTKLVYYAGGSAAVIPECTTAVGKAAFFGKEPLVSVSLPSRLNTIGEYAFSGCLNLEAVSIPDSVSSLGNGCFMSCTSLVQAAVGNGVKEIPDDCFSSCSELKSVSLGTSLISIKSQAFFSCTNLEVIDISEHVTSIEKNAIGTQYNILNDAIVPIKGVCITGKNGSAAQAYAKAAGLDFIDLSAPPMGDVNGDGFISPIDAAIVLKEYADTATGQPSSFTYYQNITGDYDKNNSITVIDAALILNEFAKSATTIS